MSNSSDKRQVVINMLLPEVRQSCVCQMFGDKGHRRGCETWERAVNLADDLLLAIT